MKILCAVIAVFVVATARSQNAQTTPAPTAPLKDSIESEVNREIWRESQGQSPLFLPAPQANEMKLDGLTCDGILVQMVKSNPLELINPAVQNGSPTDNVTWSLTHQRVTGLKLFAIQF